MEGERNLAPERGPNVWDRENLSPTPGARGRWLQGLGGAAIAVTGAALAAVGGSMVYRATRNVSGAAEGTAGAGTSEAGSEVLQQARRLEDVVAEESSQSFPASDSPSWTTTVGSSPDRTKP